jgi:hypothetical protein
MSPHRLVIQKGNPHLTKIVFAFRDSRRFTCGLNGRKQQGDKHPRDCHDHEELHQREPLWEASPIVDRPWRTPISREIPFRQITSTLRSLDHRNIES